MADSSRFQFGYILETVWGTTPASPRQNFRVTSANLKQVNNTVVSEELRADAQVSDLVRVGVQATASVDFEASYGLLDDFLTLALRNDFQIDTGFAGAQVGTDLLENNTLLKSATIEGQYSDITQFISITGARVNRLSLRMSVGQIVTGTLEFTGQVAAIAQTTVGTGGPTAATTNDVFDPVQMTGLQEAGSAVELRVIEMDIDNGARPQQVLGTASLAGIGLGRFNVTGAIEQYFEDVTILTKAFNLTASDVDWALADAAGNQLAFQVPRLKYSDGEAPAAGNDQDVEGRFPFQALADDDDTGVTLRITRTAA